MADTYGALAIPIPAPAAGEAVADPALDIMGAFFAAVLNANAQTAWSAVQPPVRGLATVADGLVNPVVRTILEHNPEEIVFDEKQLPAIYLDRMGGEAPFWYAEDYRNTHDGWRLLWIFPTAQQYTQKQRNSFTNGIVKVLDRAIEALRDPAFVWPADTDPTAASTAASPTTIKLSVASNVAAQSYSGAALDGAIGGDAFTPARLPTVTIGGTVADILAGSVVTWTGLGSDATARTSRATLAAVAGVYYGDWALTQVDTIDVEAQTGGGATLTFGLGAFAGLGSIAMVLAGLQRIAIDAWKDRTIVIQMADGAPARTYNALEIMFKVTEKLTIDLDQFDDNAARVQVTQEGTVSNAEVYEEAQFD